MPFTFDQLSQAIRESIADMGYTEPTAIQAQAIPQLLASEGDFVGQAQTGTGKTAAFCLPLLEKIDPKVKGIQAVILSPTRELANQINEELKKFTTHLPIKTATVYGGVGYRDQIANANRAQIVIATPGRAIDLLEKGKMKINNTQYLIIDEADEMLKMGFIEDVEFIMERISNGARRWMFSATMPKAIINLIEKKLDDPTIVQIKNKTLSNENITQSYCSLARRDFSKALKAILLTEDDFYGIVFCETKRETKELSEKLSGLGKMVVSLHGDLNQNQRDQAIRMFRERKADIMVCTDVAARGLDISEVTHVINMGLPRKHDSYVHRIGRTGRAGKLGKAISFVAPDDAHNLRKIEKLINKKLSAFEMPKPEQLKDAKINNELDKMKGIKSAIIDKADEFQIEESFESFCEFFADMSKEEVLKLFFTHQFNRDLRAIDDSLTSFKTSVLKTREYSGGGSRRDRGARSANSKRRGNSRRPERSRRRRSAQFSQN